MDVREKLKQQEIEDAGVWCPLRDGGEVKIAAARNPEFQRKLRPLVKMYKRTHSIPADKPIDKPDEEAQLVYKAMFGTVCKGLQKDKRGAIIGVDGKPMEFNEENFIWLMTNIRDFNDDVVAFATMEEIFEAENLEAIQGNSETA
jgi:hypothetical protein